MTARTNQGMPLFGADAERRLFLGLLANVIREFEWACLSYCLMANHVHLLVRPARANLSEGMQRLTTRYARHYNDRRQRYGHVFQGRFGSRVVGRDRYLREVLRYIALNPVRAGLCALPEDYRWSAHRALAAIGPTGLVAVDDALAGFGTDPLERAASYRAFVADRAADAEFATDYEARVAPTRTLPPDLLRLAEELDRDSLILIARREHGHSFASIARALGCARSTVARRFAALEHIRATRGV